MAALAAFIVAEQHVAYPMFDLSLLRTPTFAGGSIAAFAMNGSLYAVLLWLVIYLQDILGFSAQDAGLRIAIISAAQFVTATIAGLNDLLYVTAALALVGAVCALLLIRGKDFVSRAEPHAAPARDAASAADRVSPVRSA